MKRPRADGVHSEVTALSSLFCQQDFRGLAIGKGRKEVSPPRLTVRNSLYLGEDLPAHPYAELSSPSRVQSHF